MQPVKTKMFQSFIVGIAGLIAFSVFLLSVHAKDVFQYRELMNANRIEYRDIGEKAVGELHDHVDKQVLKSFSKTFGDGFAISRGREDDYTPEIEEDPGLLGRLQETFLLWRVYATLPFVV
jgi:hypothetical protein